MCNHTLAGPLWQGCRESRRCSRDTCPESYITKYTSIRRLKRNENSVFVQDGSDTETPVLGCGRPCGRARRDLDQTEALGHHYRRGTDTPNSNPKPQTPIKKKLNKPESNARTCARTTLLLYDVCFTAHLTSLYRSLFLSLSPPPLSFSFSLAAALSHSHSRRTCGRTTWRPRWSATAHTLTHSHSFPHSPTRGAQAGAGEAASGLSDALARPLTPSHTQDLRKNDVATALVGNRGSRDAIVAGCFGVRAPIQWVI